MKEYFSIAIDGPGGAGKSTIAKEVAKRSGANYLDTGAMYRCLGLWYHRKGVDIPASHDYIVQTCPDAPMTIRFEKGVQRMFLEGEDVTEAIRLPEASRASSQVSAFAEVRKAMVPLQQKIAGESNVVVDGRDICAVVLPNATLKLFMTADVIVRAMRRYEDERAKGNDAVKFHEVLDDLVERDYRDSHRDVSPLRKTEDAILLDTTHMSFEETVQKILELLEQAKERHE